MVATRLTKTNRRKIARRITQLVGLYLWTLTPHGETFMKDADVNPKYARQGYAEDIAKAALELLELEKELGKL